MTHTRIEAFREQRRSTQAIRERFCVVLGMLVGAGLVRLAMWVVGSW